MSPSSLRRRRRAQQQRLHASSARQGAVATALRLVRADVPSTRSSTASTAELTRSLTRGTAARLAPAPPQPRNRRAGTPPAQAFWRTAADHRGRSVRRQASSPETSSSKRSSAATKLVEPFDSPVPPVGELVISLPAPSRDHRPNEDAALIDHVLIGRRIVLPNSFGRQHAPVLARQQAMGDVELDRPTAAGLEVDDKQPSPCPQQVAQMRLAVQELLGGSGGPDRAAHAAQGRSRGVPGRRQEVRGSTRGQQPVSALRRLDRTSQGVRRTAMRFEL